MKTKRPANPPSSKRTTTDGPKPVKVIGPAETWPSDQPGPITPARVRAQVAEVYGRLRPRKQAKIAEALWNRFEFDTPYSKYYNLERLGVPGRFTLLREWTWPERFDVLERCHQAWERNPLARAGVEWTNHFVVGSGGQMSYRSKEVEEVLEEFREDPINDIRSAEREYLTALQVDGEVFVRFFGNRQGYTNIIPARPWHIHWLDTAEENYKEVTSYHYVYTIYRSAPGQSDFGTEDVPARDMLHVAINKYPYELRGRPDIFSILPWLKAYRDWLEERARINRRKTLYYVLTVKNATPDQVATLQAQFATPPAPGSILVLNENMKLESVQAHITAEEAMEDGRQIKLMAIAGMLLPEFYMAEGGESTFAAANAQSLPALRKFGDYQSLLAQQVWTPIYRHVLEHAIDAGRLPEQVQEIDTMGRPTGQTIRAVDAFSYEYPEIKEKDPKNLADALQIAASLGLVSRTTAAIKMGFDPNKEREQIQLEQRLDTGLVTPQPPPSAPPSSPGKPQTLPVSPDAPQGQVQDRQLSPSQAAPNYAGNNPPSGGAGSE